MNSTNLFKDGPVQTKIIFRCTIVVSVITFLLVGFDSVSIVLEERLGKTSTTWCHCCDIAHKSCEQIYTMDEQAKSKNKNKKIIKLQRIETLRGCSVAFYRKQQRTVTHKKFVHQQFRTDQHRQSKERVKCHEQHKHGRQEVIDGTRPQVWSSYASDTNNNEQTQNSKLSLNLYKENKTQKKSNFTQTLNLISMAK